VQEGTNQKMQTFSHWCCRNLSLQEGWFSHNR